MYRILQKIWNAYILFGERNIGISPDESDYGIEYWRARLFVRILLFVIPIGSIAYAAGFIMALVGNIPAVAITDTLVYLSLFFLTANRQISLKIRKLVFLVIIYLLAVVLILFIGFRGPGLLFILVASVLAVLLFNSKAGNLTLLLNTSIFIMLLVGLLFDYKVFTFFLEYTFGSWLAIGSSFLLINAVLVYSISSLINGLERNILNEKKLKNSLKIEGKKLRIAKERALKSARMKSAFLANMSHEIRTPLNSIIGFANILLNKNSPENQKIYIDVINKSSEQLLSLINDIINFSKIDAGAIKIEKKEVKLSNFLNTIAAAMKAICPPNLEFKYQLDFSNKKTVVFVDEQKLTQILTNLITNAFKYTMKGSVELRTGLSADLSSIEFIIKDTGIGIATEKQGSIFERFFQENSTSDGVGLGLSISNALVKALNGSIRFESEPGKGTTFYVSIPNENRQIESNYEALELSESTFDAQLDIGSMKIIVAEDNDENFEIIKEVFSSSKLQIFRAFNGKEAVELIKTDSFDLVLMDIKMPVLDGFEATRQIRKFNNKIPIIAVTAYAFNADKEMAIKAGCNDFVTKPIDLNHLSKVLARYSSSELN